MDDLQRLALHPGLAGDLQKSFSQKTKEELEQAKPPAVVAGRMVLKRVMGKASFDSLIDAGKAKLDGDRRPYDLLKSALVQFDMGFEILPGTKAVAETPKLNAFEQVPPAATDGG